MKDRISENPGRVLIVPEDGRGAFYATMALADTPQQEGTELNKASLLSDPTVSSMRMPTSPEPTVDLALRLLSGRIDNKAEKSDNKYDAVIGNYVGDGTEKRKIVLGFYPYCVILAMSCGTPFYYNGGVPYYTGGFVSGGGAFRNTTYSEGQETLVAVSDGFEVTERSVHGDFGNEAIFLNSRGVYYNYIAFKAV